MSNAPLFRAEAVAALTPDTQGDIVLLPGAGSRWVAIAAMAVVVGLASLLYWGSYTQRATVSGVLQPATGLIRVVPGSTGVVIERKALEGQDVQRGDVLFVLSSDRSAVEGVGYRDRLAAQVTAQKQLLEQERQRTGFNEDNELVQLARREQSLQNELGTLGGQIEAQRQRAALSVAASTGVRVAGRVAGARVRSGRAAKPASKPSTRGAGHRARAERHTTRP
jgi:membrane fusion protein